MKEGTIIKCINQEHWGFIRLNALYVIQVNGPEYYMYTCSDWVVVIRDDGSRGRYPRRLFKPVLEP